MRKAMVVQPKITAAVEALYGLHAGVVGRGGDRHERPHKPVLFLAVLDLIAEGKVRPEEVAWNSPLRSKFKVYFDLVKQRDDECTPENPFLYLRKEGWWQPMRMGVAGSIPLEGVPTVADAKAGAVFAQIGEPIAPFLLSPLHRMELRLALVSRYFPGKLETLSRLFFEPVMHDKPATFQLGLELGLEMDMNEVACEDDLALQVDKEPRPGRSAGFRDVILKLYDYQCAACGLRIKLPQKDVRDVTFVDAAHLIPFGESANDHPTNGMALCKNHHWAMDRNLIAPTPDGVWEVSRKLIAHRSLGESALLELRGRQFIPPADSAYHPAAESLAWRAQRLVA